MLSLWRCIKPEARNVAEAEGAEARVSNSCLLKTLKRENYDLGWLDECWETEKSCGKLFEVQIGRRLRSSKFWIFVKDRGPECGMFD